MIIRLIILLLFISPAFADKATDKAEFTRLYAEFNELYASSEGIDPVIIVAEKLYKLASRIYGNRSEEYTIVTYNLANLYDEKGGEEFNDAEKKASELYKKYFRIQNRRKVPKDLNYLNQYIPYMVAYYNSHPQNAKTSIAEQMLKLAYSLELQKIELANIEYMFAIQNAKLYRYKIAKPYFQKSYKTYLNELGEDHFKVAESLFWLAKIDLAYEKTEQSIENLLKMINTFHGDDEQSVILKNNALHFLAIIYYAKEEIELVDKYYKLINNAVDPTPYLIPVYKPDREPELFAGNLYISADYYMQYDVDENGHTYNIQILEVYNPSASLAMLNTNAGTFDQTAIHAVSRYKFLPPIFNGKNQAVTDIKDTVRFRPIMRY